MPMAHGDLLGHTPAVLCCRQESDLEALMTDLVAEEKAREAALAAHEAALSELRTEVATAQVQHLKYTRATRFAIT